MKLKRILSGFLAGAVALSSMVFSSVTASAADMVTVVINSDLPISIAVIRTPGTYNVNGNEVVDTNYWTQLNRTEKVDGVDVDTIYGGAFTTSEEGGYTDSFTISADSSIGTANFSIYGWSNDDSVNVRYADFSVDLSRIENGKVNVGLKADGEVGELQEGWYKDKPYTLEYITADTTVYEENTYTETSMYGDNVYKYEGTWDNSAVSGPNASLTVNTTSSNGCGFHIEDLDGNILVENVWCAGASYSTLLSGIDVSNGIQINSWGAGAGTTWSIDSITIKNEEGKTVYTPYVAPSAYTITIADTENGTVVAKVGGVEATEAEEDATVALEVTPDEGYALDTLTVAGASGDVTLTEDNTFLMPDEDVTVTATFVAVPTYTITIADTENGTVEADVAEAKEGDIVTVTATPDKGYEFDYVTVKGESGTNYENSASVDGVCTFTMPDENVTVGAVFTEIQVTQVALTPDAFALAPEETQQLKATITPATALNQKLTWSSKDETVATVDQNGLVTAVGEGSTQIVATCANGIYGTATVTVTLEKIPAESIVVEPSTLELEIGEGVAITATVTPDSCTDTVIWTSEDTSVATVVNGFVEAVGEGTTNIIVTAGTVSAKCVVTVKKPIEETGYDKVEANFEADTIVAQKATNADGTTNVRVVKMVKEADIANKGTVTFTLKNKAGTVKTVTSKNYYMSLVASGNKVTPKDGHVFLAITVTDIPEGEEVTCTDITLS